MAARGRADAGAPRLVMLGPFPPPVGGAARITEALYEALRQRGARVLALDTSATQLSHTRSVTYHAGRLLRTITLFFVVLSLAARGRPHYYVVPDGGFGVWYSLALVLACRVRCGRLVFHHHTCRYVDNRDIAMAQIVESTRRFAEHIFLTPGMASTFQAQYGPVRHRIVGNAAFTQPALLPAEDRQGQPLVLGHLSNLCREKGFLQVCAAFEAIAGVRDDVRLHVAGPVLEHEVTTELDRLHERFGDRVQYHGPLDGLAKTSFYDSLDVFLFPTQFRQEAAPNVLYEAAALGVPSVAIARGRVGEIVQDLGGVWCLPGDDYPQFATRFLSSADVKQLRGSRSDVRATFVAAHRRDSQSLQSLVDDLTATAPIDFPRG